MATSAYKLSVFDTKWDVLVVGAGPAGLFAAMAVASTSRLRVLVIEEGADVNERHRTWIQHWESNHQRHDYVRGVGGAGLYSDGKLCFSLNIGGQLKSRLNRQKKDELLVTIAKYFGLSSEFEQMEVASEAEIKPIERIAGQQGLEFKYYPVLQIGTEECRNLIINLRKRLKDLGVVVVSRCSLKDLRQNGKRWKEAVVEFDNVTRTILADKVVLALGKVGSDLETTLCKNLGIGMSSRPMYIGVRLETKAEHLEPLFTISKDPKFSMRFRDGSKIKTHCASRNGQVLALSYDGLPIAGGQNFHKLKTGRSGFSILWDGIKFENGAYQVARLLMSKVGKYTDGSLLAQTLKDYQAGRSSSECSFDNIKLSNPIYKSGNLRDFLPDSYFERFDEFLGKLAKIAPQILSSETVLYAPAIEWWMNHIELANDNMETNCEGLYVCGDGSGWSQGIIHAAASGLLAAEGITQKSVRAPLAKSVRS